MTSIDLRRLIDDCEAMEHTSNVKTAMWYLLASIGLAASSCGSDVVNVFRQVIDGQDVSTQTVIQRRLKETLLKTAFLYGIPRALQALMPLYDCLSNDEIDQDCPRYASLNAKGADAVREERGKSFFETLWGISGANANNDFCLKYHKDLLVMNKLNMEWMMSENSILDEVETEMVNIAALVCSNSPTQVQWHMKGVSRFGGSLEQARLAHEIGTKVAAYCKIKMEK